MAQTFHVVSYNVQYDSPVPPPDAARRIGRQQMQLAGFQEVFEPLGFSVALVVPYLLYRLVMGHAGMRRALEGTLRRLGFFTEWESYGRPWLPIAILLLGAQRVGLLSAALEFPRPQDPVRFEVHGTDWRLLSNTTAGGVFPLFLGREIRIAHYLSVTLKPPPADPQLGDLPIDFFNVHLSDRSPARRAREIAKLLAFIDEKRRASSADVQIVVGDFNAEPNDPEIAQQMVAQGGFVDAWAQVGAGPGHTYDSRAAGGPTRRIDYVFVNASALGPAPNLRLTGAQTIYGDPPLISDHLGVCAMFERG